MTTTIQKANVVTRYISYIVVCDVYGSGKQCTIAGKEDIAYGKFKLLAVDFVNRSGIFTSFNEIAFVSLSLNDISYFFTEGEILRFFPSLPKGPKKLPKECEKSRGVAEGFFTLRGQFFGPKGREGMQRSMIPK